MLFLNSSPLNVLLIPTHTQTDRHKQNRPPNETVRAVFILNDIFRIESLCVWFGFSLKRNVEKATLTFAGGKDKYRIFFPILFLSLSYHRLYSLFRNFFSSCFLRLF